jgi:hypothetical protein
MSLEKYRHPAWCKEPFSPNPIGYCWSWACHIDGGPGNEQFADIASICRGCEACDKAELALCEEKPDAR